MSNRLSTPKQQPKAEHQAQSEKQRPAPRAKPKPKQKKPFFLQKLRRQEIFLLTGLLSLACFSVIVIGLLVLRFQAASARPGTTQPGDVVAGPQPTHTVTFVEITALSQYRLAEVEARNWSGDAQLVSANTNWPGVLNQEQIGAPSQWTYQFFSPSKGHLFIVKVEPDGQSQSIEHVAPITLPPPVLGTGDWVVDSPAALALWLDHGGADLVRTNPGLEILIQLRHLNNQPNPVWMVIGTDTRTQSLLVVVVDVIEGTVITTKSSG